MRSRPLPPLLVAFVALVSTSAVDSVRAQIPAAGEPTLVDRVVAVVDEDPILNSDIERVLRLGLVPEIAGEQVADERRRALDMAIEQKLRLHEVDRFGFEESPLAAVDRQMEETRSRFPSEEAFRAELLRLGLDETALRQLLARQLSVLAYVEERLGPRVFVSVDDIGHYYDEELLPELRKNGAGPGDIPALDSVRESIRAVLRERRLNDEIDRWTDDLRSKADVVDYLDREARPLPPVVGERHGAAGIPAP
ncbi:MAG: hypothetical protein ABIV06_11640 [Thermoanaerobaculia bacterium]